MPASTGSQSSLASLPSFMSIVGNQPDRRGPEHPDLHIEPSTTSDVGLANATSQNTTHWARKPNSALNYRFSPVFRRDSASTYGSVSSSPTTTVSTVESSLTEPSPSSSPESPDSILLHSPVKRANSTPSAHEGMDLPDQPADLSHPSSSSDRASSPNKKMRNMKNLSVNTSASTRQASQLSKVSLPDSVTSPPIHASSAPPTPAFIVPPKPHRKPSLLGLSITTTDSNLPTTLTNQERPPMVPQTPSDHHIRSLRLLQKTSSHGSLNSPTHAPEGGMRLPPLNNMPFASRWGASSRPPLSISPRTSFDASVASPISKQTLDHVQEEPDYELPLSQEAKSPAYPQGPVCIYDPHVYLYLEPTHTEAQEFDVILNVAREVQNPFAIAAEEALHATISDQGSADLVGVPNAHLTGRIDVSEPYTAASARSSGLVSQHWTEHAVPLIPDTPRASKAEPEYIHVPWDHNTNVVDDLLRLCELIDERVLQEKRVLIHCQCGVSRSASLVVAYGLYKNPQLTVQEAYDAVKDRSRWIGPNMNLIYQLSEFKSKLANHHRNGATPWQPWRSFGTARTNTGTMPKTETSPVARHDSPQKSLSAPSPLETSGQLRASSFSFPSSDKLTVCTEEGSVTPGPSSAPPDMAWSLELPVIDTPGKASHLDDGHVLSEDVHEALPLDRETDSAVSLLLPRLDDSAHEQAVSPVGGVAIELAQVASDLNQTSISAERSTDHEIPTSRQQMRGRMESDNTPLNDPRARLTDNAESTHLPAGFSSLLNRRQGTQSQRLPLRHAIPTFTPSQTAGHFNPILHDDVPPTPSILSPRAAEFMASPFHRTAAGDLAGSPVFEQGLTSPTVIEEDPRSPHQAGEAPVTRSILGVIEKPPS